MTFVFSTLLLFSASFYAALVGACAWGFRRVRRASPPAAPQASSSALPPLPDAPFVSVVIAARNEEASVETCLRALLASDYPAGRFEVIVVDDFSTDQTAALVRRTQQARQPVLAGALPDDPVDAVEADEVLRLFRMRDVASGAAGHKKAALMHGIAQARGDLIVTTDADCTAGPGWLPAMVDCFTPGTAFVSGPVRYRPGQTAFGQIQALEFLSLVTFGAGSIGWGRPSICNSANVAYRRDVYDRLTADAASNARHNDGLGAADDELLMQRVARETDAQVRFCADPAAVVETDPAPSLAAFVRQRRRWASMNTSYPDAGLIAALSGLYAFFVLLLVGLVAVWFAPALGAPLLFALGLKIGADAVLMVPASQHFELSSLLPYLLLAQPLHIVYVVYIGAAGLLGDIHWKGRQIS